MRILKQLRNDAILVAVVCVAGVVAYQVLLDDEAKQGVREAVHSVYDSYKTVTTFINDHIGTIMDDDVVAQNREQIKNAWADLGF